MTKVQSTINDEIERYLRTGGSDPLYAVWPGNFMERALWVNATPSGAGKRKAAEA
jgi:hypothetical protein